MSLKSSPFWGASAKNIHIEGLPKVYCYYIFEDSPGNSFRIYPGSRSGINSLRSSTDSRCSEIKSTISFPCSRNCSEFIFADNTLELSIFYGLFATENNCSTMNWFVAPNRRFIDFDKNPKIVEGENKYIKDYIWLPLNKRITDFDNRMRERETGFILYTTYIYNRFVKCLCSLSNGKFRLSSFKSNLLYKSSDYKDWPTW